VGKFDPLFYLNLFGYNLGVTYNLLMQWIIIAIITIGVIILTRNLKKVPDRRQVVVEIFVNTINNLVKDNMGEEFTSYVPYIGTLCIYILFMNITGLFGFRPPTQDFNVGLGLALISFAVIQYTAIKKNGLGNYFGGYFRPYAALVPLNLIDRVMLPVSLSLRLFGNITAAVVVMDLVYTGLGHLSWFALLLIPVPVHFFFDLFDAGIQMIIFVMLTLINIKVISEH
jgi:F-type H+-transporting ATPase subunit a